MGNIVESASGTFKGKKLLVLAGSHQHCKIVRAARELGVYTIATDNLENSPAKMLADEEHRLDIKDIEGNVELCKREQVDGVLAGYIDPAQRPYQQICEALNVPCFGTREQFFTMTDKHAFKKQCMRCGVDVVPEYSLEDVRAGKCTYPLLIKPVDSRGSRGQSVCNSYNDVERAIEFAKSESSNGDVLIERYMGNKNEFQVTYFFIDGVPHLLRTADRYLGRLEDGLEKVGICTVSPSKFTEEYIETADLKVREMFADLGIKNGPVFMQGFHEDGKFYFFDPGMRFPGSDFENLFKLVYGVDIMQSLVEFALTGKMTKLSLPEDCVNLNGKRIALMFPTVRAGKITQIRGIDEIKNDKRVIEYFPRHNVGDTVGWTYNLNQRVAEIDIIAENADDLKSAILMIQQKLHVIDENGQEMLYGNFNADNL